MTFMTLQTILKWVNWICDICKFFHDMGVTDSCSNCISLLDVKLSWQGGVLLMIYNIRCFQRSNFFRKCRRTRFSASDGTEGRWDISQLKFFWVFFNFGETHRGGTPVSCPEITLYIGILIKSPGGGIFFFSLLWRC